MRIIVFFILVMGIHITAPSYAGDVKVFSDSDLKNYSSPSEGKSSEYNRKIIDKQRAVRERDDRKMLKEEVRRNLEKSEQQRAEAIDKANFQNEAKKKYDKQRRVCTSDATGLKTVCENE